MVIRGRLGANRLQTSFQAMGLAGLSRFGELYVGTTRQEPYGVYEIDVVKLSDVRDDVSAFAAAEAMPGLRNGINLA